MAQPRRGRPPNPLDPNASHAAKLGAEIRDRRTDAELTLEQLANQVGFSQQHISEVERAKTTPGAAFVAAVDRALEADGAIERLLPLVLEDREGRRQERAQARRAAQRPYAATHSEVPADPATRVGLRPPIRPKRRPSDLTATLGAPLQPPGHAQRSGQPNSPHTRSGRHRAQRLDLSPDAPLATLVRERCPGVRLSRTTPDLGIDWTLMLPGNSVIAVQVHPATTEPEGRVRVEVHDVRRLHEFLRTPHRALLLGIAQDPDPRIYVLDARTVRHKLAECHHADAVLSIPLAYELDDLTYGVLWAASNLDDRLLADDLALAENQRKLRAYQRLPASEVTREVAGDLTESSRAWLGSAFCAQHILRNFGHLGDLPLFWTREQRGAEACTWLLFSHKLAYLHATRQRFGSASMVRVFCVPDRAVRDSPRFERILLFLAIALMEAHGVHVQICTEHEYSDVEGFLLAPRRAIVATWIRADSMWHVDTTARRPILTSFAEASGHAAAHSVIAAPTSTGRLAALAHYLELDLAWLNRRCIALARQGCKQLVGPRSRLLAVTGVETACASVTK